MSELGLCDLVSCLGLMCRNMMLQSFLSEKEVKLCKDFEKLWWMIRVWGLFWPDTFCRIVLQSTAATGTATFSILNWTDKTHRWRLRVSEQCGPWRPWTSSRLMATVFFQSGATQRQVGTCIFHAPWSHEGGWVSDSKWKGSETAVWAPPQHGERKWEGWMDPG